MTLKSFLVIPLICCFLAACHSSRWLKEDGEWQVLFNGQDLDGWIPKFHHHEVGENYANTFRVNDGVVQVNYDGYNTFDERYGHLFYGKPFSYYHLKFEYRFTDQWMED